MTAFNEQVTEFVQAVNSAVRERRDYVKLMGEKRAVKAFKDTLADRDYRKQVMSEMLSNHFLQNERMPDNYQMQRLTDAMLCEELTDNHPDKTAREEYPIFSDTQLARRKAGVHRKKDGGGIREVSLGLAENYGTDGRSYEYPVRRKRTWQEDAYVDEQAQSRNAEYRKKHRDFILGKTEGLFTVNIESGEKVTHEPASEVVGPVVREWHGNNFTKFSAE